MNDWLLDAFSQAKAITNRASTTYALAFRFFPSDIRDAGYAMYAFFRTADDIVDVGKGNLDDIRRFRDSWEKALEGDRAIPLLAGAAYVFKKYSIPVTLTDEFFRAMEMDAVGHCYETFSDLEVYMNGAAGTVGEVMAHVIGFSSSEALVSSRQLGVAAQLTNILRDVREDYDMYGRVYIPTETLDQFAVTPADIADCRMSPAMRNLIRDLLERNRLIYSHAEVGLRGLSERGQLGVRLMARSSREILRAIERNNFNVFESRATIPTWTRVRLLSSAAVSAVLGQPSF
ncbi:MAG: phytoene/squalene synthase family protein [Patescibacteria group bacterium]